MLKPTEEIVNILIENLSQIPEVQAIGISGGDNPYPKAGEGDIDIFIYCDEIPVSSVRQECINRMNDYIRDGKSNVFESDHWGKGDYVSINGIETWLMYFTVHETMDDLKAILDGKYPDRVDQYYYPIGRCAMLKNIHVLFDKSKYLEGIKDSLSDYPEELANTVIRYHMNKLNDLEDLERAVTRKDVLFYHFALDLAIDHFLQALFAINRTYFPSRKRSFEVIESFKIKPQKCSELLLDVVKYGSYPEGIEQSYKILINLLNAL